MTNEKAPQLKREAKAVGQGMTRELLARTQSVLTRSIQAWLARWSATLSGASIRWWSDEKEHLLVLGPVQETR